MPVRAVDLPEIAQRPDEICRSDLRSRHVLPFHDRQFIDGMRCRDAAVCSNVAGDDLDVEDPSRYERLGEDVSHRRSHAKDLRAALRVVHSEAER